MSTESERALSLARKWRGVVKASINRMEARITELESKIGLSAEDKLTAQHLSQRLSALETEFKTHHLAVVDLTDEGSLEGEKTMLDEIDDRVANLIVRETVGSVVDSTSLDSGLDVCLMRQYEEQLTGLKTELTSVSHGILSLAREDPKLLDQQSRLSQRLFDVSLKIKCVLQGKATAHASTPDKTGVKLPKITVPTFDGNVSNWCSFWEQFVVIVHDRATLSKTEKLAYLKRALDGTSKQVIEGLSSSGDQYDEAVSCLTKRYDRPQLLHQAHVRAIIDAPSLKDGSGRDLRRLHDAVNQHLRALKAMKYDPLDTSSPRGWNSNLTLQRCLSGIDIPKSPLPSHTLISC